MTIWAVASLFAVAFQSASLPVVSGSQLVREGRLQEALDGYLHAVEASPKSAAANEGAGVVLDLMGRYEEARKYFTQAIKVTTNPDERVKAQRALATSFGFAGDCRGAEKSDRTAYEYFLQAPDYYSAGEVADELGRLCLDAGDPDVAYDWYRRGHDAGLRETNIPAARKDLWEFRWAHARARIAARRGKSDEARKFVVAAKTIFDKGAIPDQQFYLSYLAGYIAFYAGDFAAALAEFRNADQSDSFVQCLIAQIYEKLGDTTAALEYYRKAAGTTAHSVAAAYARPYAIAKLK
jgi:tetratricopeptide (TPR) repeat protein